MVFAELANFGKFLWKWQWDFETFSFGVAGFLFGLWANFSYII